MCVNIKKIEHDTTFEILWLPIKTFRRKTFIILQYVHKA